SLRPSWRKEEKFLWLRDFREAGAEGVAAFFQLLDFGGFLGFLRSGGGFHFVRGGADLLVDRHDLAHQGLRLEIVGSLNREGRGFRHRSGGGDRFGRFYGFRGG